MISKYIAKTWVASSKDNRTVLKNAEKNEKWNRGKPITLSHTSGKTGLKNNINGNYI